VRVTALIDGFNLYHTLDGLGQHHLNWLDLRALCEEFAPQPQFRLVVRAVPFLVTACSSESDADRVRRRASRPSRESDDNAKLVSIEL
jgi:hypothetical protein